MNKEDLLIIGAGGHARVVIDTAQLCGYNVVGIIDPEMKDDKEVILGISVIGGIDKLSEFEPDTNAFIAIGDNQKRQNIFEEFRSSGYKLPSLTHPTAALSKHIEIGDGSLINAGSIVNAGVKIGKGAIINTGAILDHEVEVGDFVHIGPGVKVGGRTKIGKHSFVGLGTSVIDYITIGEHVIIGAGSTILKDIASNLKVVGVSKIID